MGITNNEKELIKGVLLSATHKMIKELQQSKIVSLLDFYNFCEAGYKGEEPFLGFITKLNYNYKDYSRLYVTIKCNYLGTKFRITFFMGEPHGKFNDRTPIAYNLNVEEFLKD